MGYVIEQNIIPGLPKVPFRNGQYEGVVNHCTDSVNHNGGDTPTNERNYESRTYNSAFVHFFIGVESNKAKIVQCAPLEYGAYGAGKTANARYIHIELCMYDDQNLFKLAYDAYVWLTAKLLHDRGLKVVDNLTLLSHKEVADDWHETTHSDPINYLASHGIWWQDHIENVKGEYEKMDAKFVYFYTGGYGGQAIGNIHSFITSKKYWFQPSRGDDGSLFFLIGAFVDGSTQAEEMENYLKQNHSWYVKRDA
jgi:N-acetylmuramoyl-L-alanine amidase CwlA